jgi:hypothetical protein
MQKKTKENKKREILELFYKKNYSDSRLPQESKSDNKQKACFQNEIQLSEYSKSQIKKADADENKNSIQNILISKFNFSPKNPSEIGLEESFEQINNKNQMRKIGLSKFSDNVNYNYNATRINMLNYTNSYKNLINVNSLSVFNMNSNKKNYNSLTSNSNKKFSACKKSPSSIKREKFYDQINIDYSQVSKNLDMDNIKFKINKGLNDKVITNYNYDDYYDFTKRNSDYIDAKNSNKKKNYDNDNKNYNSNQEYSSNNFYNEQMKIKEINEKKIDFLIDEELADNRKEIINKDLSMIDANINISLKTSSVPEANKTINPKKPTNLIKSQKQSNTQNYFPNSNNTAAENQPKTNSIKLKIESKSNSPIGQELNKDFDDTMNVITESSLRNLNLNFNHDNINSNVNSDNAKLNNIFSYNYINSNLNIVSNANSTISYNNNINYKKNTIIDKCKKDSKKTENYSFFKSEDMRISKMENMLLHNVNNLNSNTNNISLYYNQTSNNNSNNTLLNFNNTNNNNSNNNTIINKENSNFYNLNNHNNNVNYNLNATSNNSSFTNNNLNFKKNNLNNLNTNSLSDYLNFNNQQNIYSPLSTSSNLNCKNTLTANLLGINSNEKKQNKIYIQYDSKSEGVLNAFTGTLTPSRQNSFNLNVFVSRNDSNFLLNSNNHINNCFNINNNQNNLTNNFNENTECGEKLFGNLFKCENNNENSIFNKRIIYDEEESIGRNKKKFIEKNIEIFEHKNFKNKKNIKNNNKTKLNIDRISDISIFEDNDLNEDCVENQKYSALKYEMSDLEIANEIELEFCNK